MDIYSGSALKALGELCERNGLRDIAVQTVGEVHILWATTGYLADGSPIVTEITHSTTLHGLRENVQGLVWAWGRK